MVDGWVDGVDEIMMGDLSKTMVRGKQNDTGWGGAMKNDEIYMTHKAKIVTTDSAPVSWTGMAMGTHGTPSFLNISSNVLKATGLTKLWFRRS